MLLKKEIIDDNKKLREENRKQKQEIERLNKKIEQYENPEDMTLMFMWCNEKAKDEIKRLNNIINELEKYINEKYIYDELGMKIFDASELQDKLQEIADVMVMLKQFQYYYGIEDSEIEKIMLEKIQRQLKRIEEEK